MSESDQARNRDSKRASMKPAEMLSNVPLLAVMLVSFISRFGFGLLIGTFALFAEAVLFVGQDFGAVSLGVGLLLMVVGVGQFFTQIVILPAALRIFGDPMIVILGGLARAAGMFTLAVATSPLLGSVSMVAFAVGSGLLLPALQSLVTKTVPQEMRGGILGAHQSVMSLGVIISTAVSGGVFALDPSLPNWLGGALICLATLPAGFLWLWSRKNGVDQGALALAAK